MPPDTSLHGIDTRPETIDDDALHEPESAAFTAAWQPADTTLLHPGNLPLARVQRAWERKPSSPLSRRKVRVGKMWKRVLRPGASRSTVSSAEEMVTGLGGSGVGRSRTSLPSPLRAVKKLRVEAGEGLVGGSAGAAQVVSRWEMRESPVRKIVTRSAVGCGLVALPDVEQEEVGSGDVGGATYEVIGENGGVTVVDEITAEDGREWLDVEDSESLEVREETVMKQGEAVLHARHLSGINASGSREGVTDLGTTGGQDDDQNPENGATTSESRSKSTALQPAPLINVQPRPIPAAEVITLPEGFVSPVKRRKLGPRASRMVSESRRKTLPVQFAPAILANAHIGALLAEDDPEVVEAEVAPTDVTPIELNMQTFVSGQNDGSFMADIQEPVAVLRRSDWEDVEGEAFEAATAKSSDDSPGKQMTLCLQIAGALQEPVQEEYAAPQGANERPCHNGTNIMEDIHVDPITSIEASHTQAPSRRSPRRKSSSPLKQRPAVMDKPHHMAFTPLKPPSLSVDLRHDTAGLHDAKDESMRDVQDTLNPIASLFQRASSAPPEEPQMSPRKPAKSRVSDDTALLQAFLNRAAESKSTRRLSATEKESLSNRRDSDTIRQALASPPRPEVLMDLDPNSPSPRKQQPALAISETSQDAATPAPDTPGTIEVGHDSTEEAGDSASGVRTRRSGRGRRKPQIYSQSDLASSAPARINIRGLANGVDVLKKAETQSLAYMTRNNTRLNKGESVPPKPRMVKMALETISAAAFESTSATASGAEAVAEPEEMLDVVVDDGKRRIRWAEQLISFYQGSTSFDTSQLSDEPEERMPWERGADFDPTEEPKQGLDAPVPAAETPSKPKAKLRTLKAPRAASTPAKKTSAANAAKVTDVIPAPAADADSQVKTAPRPRRSRIATPAKGLANASLLPADLAPVSASAPAPTATKETAAPTRKRAGTSRLLPPGTLAAGVPTAPTSVTLASATTNGAGKENLTIASPPKKRSTSGASGPAPSLTSAPAVKLDFGKSVTGLKPPTTATKLDITGNGISVAVPSLASPAKKAGERRAAMFGNSTVAASAEGREGGEPLAMGMSSPAKKRNHESYKECNKSVDSTSRDNDNKAGYDNIQAPDPSFEDAILPRT
ncbi:hypothetical protein LTR91_019608 [Friedmanniomyces endolithicus]|uniref:Uncharacterized protein n=1 Tax=Friedmanniomyces endolithicus TaxID=329885 RepID=A0AAN6HAA0_9PEZI|nr:hypothetical protein LTR57_023578 [Friedmanniomyces endolithicus]KAK0958862.1 hypothetical protein LTS01_021673 [Friedmanniomyces endolithicus]KAK0962101.1 hypothetical protein LTR91_019608 [Friedmanniomyces endolithicus]KAK1022902.1 hypothetical protein LTS16_025344 [Friedmanniomyces endolithicus]